MPNPRSLRRYVASEQSGSGRPTPASPGSPRNGQQIDAVAGLVQVFRGVVGDDQLARAEHGHAGSGPRFADSPTLDTSPAAIRAGSPGSGRTDGSSRTKRHL